MADVKDDDILEKSPFWNWRILILRNLIKKENTYNMKTVISVLQFQDLICEAYQDYVFYECRLQAHVVLLPMGPTLMYTLTIITPWQ